MLHVNLMIWHVCTVGTNSSWCHSLVDNSFLLMQFNGLYTWAVSCCNSALVITLKDGITLCCTSGWIRCRTSISKRIRCQIWTRSESTTLPSSVTDSIWKWLTVLTVETCWKFAYLLLQKQAFLIAVIGHSLHVLCCLQLVALWYLFVLWSCLVIIHEEIILCYLV